jgi:hypothetical protein
MKAINKYMDNIDSGGNKKKNSPLNKSKVPPQDIKPEAISEQSTKVEPKTNHAYEADIKQLINEVLQENIHLSYKKRQVQDLTHTFNYHNS